MELQPPHHTTTTIRKRYARDTRERKNLRTRAEITKEGEEEEEEEDDVSKWNEKDEAVSGTSL